MNERIQAKGMWSFHGFPLIFLSPLYFVCLGYILICLVELCRQVVLMKEKWFHKFRIKSMRLDAQTAKWICGDGGMLCFPWLAYWTFEVRRQFLGCCSIQLVLSSLTDLLIKLLCHQDKCHLFLYGKKNI